MQKERLHKIIARSGITSRRKAERLIISGRVRVNRKIVKELGIKVNPRKDKIYVDGRLLHPDRCRKYYYLAYKPRFMLTTLSDSQNRPTVADLLQTYYINIKLFPVGRLDWNAEGLLLLTNDGELAHRIMHPRTHLPKIYLVKVRGRPGSKILTLIRNGLRINCRTKYLPAQVKIIRKMPKFTVLRITLYEGKQSQIKKMFGYLGYVVLHIKRVSIGPLTLGHLFPGAIRPLTPSEERKLKKTVENLVKVDGSKN